MGQCRRERTQGPSVNEWMKARLRGGVGWQVLMWGERMNCGMEEEDECDNIQWFCRVNATEFADPPD